ncbi:hypothetical protein WME94_26430 [Sorangium sp. So ce429]
MPKSREPLMVVTFKGPRFEDHGIDLRDLSVLIAIRGALVRYAEEIYREEHGKAPPRSFVDNIQLRIYGIGKGSAALEIYDETSDAEPAETDDKQLILIEQAAKKRRTARQRNKEAARRVSRAVSGKDTNIPDDVLSPLRRLITPVSGDDDYVIDVPEAPEAPPPAAAATAQPQAPAQPPANDTDRGDEGDIAARESSYGSEPYRQWPSYMDQLDEGDQLVEAPYHRPSQPQPQPQPVAEAAVIDSAARQRLAQVIAERKPPKATQVTETEEQQDILVEGDLARAVVSTVHGDAVSLEFAHDVDRQRVRIVGRGVQDPKTKKFLVESISSIRLVAQLDLFQHGTQRTDAEPTETLAGDVAKSHNAPLTIGNTGLITEGMYSGSAVGYVRAHLGDGPWTDIVVAADSKLPAEFCFSDIVSFAADAGFDWRDVHVVVEVLTGDGGFIERLFVKMDETPPVPVEHEEVARRLRARDRNEDVDGQTWEDWSSRVNVVWKWTRREGKRGES